jgi:heme-binding NEAT domain protein
MHDTTAIAAPKTTAPQTATPQTKPYVGKNANPRYGELYRRYPTIDYLRRGAGRRLPSFSF